MLSLIVVSKFSNQPELTIDDLPLDKFTHKVPIEKMSKIKLALLDSGSGRDLRMLSDCVTIINSQIREAMPLAFPDRDSQIATKRFLKLVHKTAQ